MSTKLKSSDGEIFSVPNNLLQKSDTLKSMLDLCVDGTPSEDEDSVSLDKISSKFLKIIVNWMQRGDLPEEIECTDLHHLIVHSNYLNVPDLLNQLCHILIDNISRREKLHNIKFDLIMKPQCFYKRCKVVLVGDENLKTVCVKCGIAKYCSKNCQKGDWSLHKATCKKICFHTKKLEKEDRWGDFCLRAEYALAETLLKLADEKKQSLIYEKSLFHYMEVLRLNPNDNDGIRYTVPSILLKLNRDEDCHNFLKSWCTVDHDNPRYDWRIHLNSKEGDWLYLTNQDIYEDPTLFNHTVEGVQFFNAFLCTRLRIVSKFRLTEAVEACITNAISGGVGLGHLPDVLPFLREIILGENNSKKDFSLDRQEEILQNILSLVKRSNKSFLPAILNPGPLFSNEHPTCYSRGNTAETYFALKSSLELFSSISIARDVIAEFCGNDTAYDSNIDDIFYMSE